MVKILHFSKKIKLAFVIVLIFASTTAISQTEYIVEEGLNTINDAVKAHPGGTLVLKRGGYYLVDVQVEINNATIIKGQTEPAATQPPIVQFMANPGEAVGKNIFAIAANCTLQNFGIMGFTPDDQQVGGNNTSAANVAVTKDGITLIIDGCIFQGSHTSITSSDHNKLIITFKNNIFYNLTNLGWDNWGGFVYGFGGDFIDFKAFNNTYVNCGRLFNGALAGENSTELMEHNSYVATWGDTYYPSFAKNFTSTNNIFYDSQVRGYVGVRKIPGYPDWPGDFTDWAMPGMTDTLCGDVAVFPHKLDSTKARSVIITNNLKMYSKRVLDFNKANNVTTMTFFNVSGYKFANRYGWVVKDNILQENGNTVDPKFEMGEIPEGAYTNMFLNRQQRWLPKELQSANFPYENAWRPNGEAQGQFIWPLPFKLKPTNQSIWKSADDGYPLGDLNWFGKDVVAAWEKGESSPITSASIMKNDLNKMAYISNDVLRFKGFDGSVDVELYSILGQKVLEIKNVEEVNVSGLKNGIYLVRVNNGGQTFKVVK